MTDRALVAAVLAAEPGAFERLVREHQALCWHIVLRLVRDPEDARDLCQETFLRVHRHLDQYRFDSALKTWIGRVAYSVALRHLERKGIPLAETALSDDEPLAVVASDEDVQALASQGQIAAILRAHIARLPPIQSLLLTLYHFDELTIPEISAATGLPSGTIKSHLSRARARLRDTLALTLGERP
ncbi:MAG: sigma-70 family RNA polymerase sigma factor [Lysobacteraceae bacterium]|nr:MAG: sigma-70 family RNA polymerase sigma factor [Xanthomonadaceae bacterium]